MKQNLVSLVFTPAEIEDLKAAITRIEKFTESFVTLTPDELRRLAKLGDGTEPFCRQATVVFEQYPHAFPPSFDLAEMQRDLATFDALRGPLLRLQQLVSRFDDTVTALGSTPQSAAAFLSMGGSLPCSAAQPLHETDQRPAAIIPKAAKTAAEPLVENRIPPSPQAFPPRRPGAPRQPVKILQQPPCFSRRHPHIGFKC